MITFDIQRKSYISLTSINDITDVSCSNTMFIVMDNKFIPQQLWSFIFISRKNKRTHWEIRRVLLRYPN